jgi:hypothetical protein
LYYIVKHEESKNKQGVFLVEGKGRHDVFVFRWV